MLCYDNEALSARFIYEVILRIVNILRIIRIWIIIGGILVCPLILKVILWEKWIIIQILMTFLIKLHLILCKILVTKISKSLLRKQSQLYDNQSVPRIMLLK